MNDADKAEYVQSLKAYLIPSSMFVACLFNAAGIYIMYAGNTVGLVFLGAGFAIIIGALFAFVTFQNKHRADGTSPHTARPASPEHEEVVERFSYEDAREEIKTR